MISMCVTRLTRVTDQADSLLLNEDFPTEIFNIFHVKKYRNDMDYGMFIYFTVIRFSPLVMINPFSSHW